MSLIGDRCVFNILRRNVYRALTSRHFDNNVYGIIYCAVLLRALWVGHMASAPKRLQWYHILKFLISDRSLFSVLCY